MVKYVRGYRKGRKAQQALLCANLLRKLNEGKSLSDKEFKHLQSLADAPSSPFSAKGRNASQIKRSLGFDGNLEKALS